MTEFGTPMDCTFRRGHEGFEGNITSEPLLTEYAAIYFGTDAYTAEEPNYRQYLHSLFRGGMLYNSSGQDRLDRLRQQRTKSSFSTASKPGGVGAPRVCRAACALVVDAGRAQGNQLPDPGVDRRPAPEITPPKTTTSPPARSSRSKSS